MCLNNYNVLYKFLIKVIQVELKELKCPASVLTFCRTTELPTVLKALMLMHTTEVLCL